MCREFANSREVQTAWLTVLNSNLKSYADFLKLSRDEQVAFFQISSLFESLGVLLDRGIITLQTVDDMFVPLIAWRQLKPFLEGVSATVGSDNFPYFAKLVSEMDKPRAPSPPGKTAA